MVEKKFNFSSYASGSASDKSDNLLGYKNSIEQGKTDDSSDNLLGYKNSIEERKTDDSKKAETAIDLREMVFNTMLKIETFQSQKKHLATDVKKLKEEVEKVKKEVKVQNSKSIEIIGIFSSILALLIIDVNIVKSAPNFLSSILLITALTCSLSFFAGLIHFLFSSDEEKKYPWTIWTPTIILALLIISGAILQFTVKINLYEDTSKTSLSVTSDAPDPFKKNFSLQILNSRF